jgi:SAM-dependent methyltransferase
MRGADVSAQFGEIYARWYDEMYRSKDYAGEIDAVLSLATSWLDAPPSDVLDLGCGTGGHVRELARRGMRVTGVDCSAAMLKVAAAKSVSSGGVRFVEGDVRDADLGQQFDLVTMMFAVLSYQVATADVLAALRTIRRHLRPGGVAALDVWYGPAVLVLGPSDRASVLEARGGARLVRMTRGVLDSAHHTCEVRYRLIEFDAGTVRDAEETHPMRYFFPMELRLMCEIADLEVVELMPAPCESAASLGFDTWNAWAMVRNMRHE